MRLGLWLIKSAETILADMLNRYMMDQHILGSLKEALNTIVSGVYLMQTQNINLCLTIERAIAPTLLKLLGVAQPADMTGRSLICT